jgi:hypothetical protein
MAALQQKTLTGPCTARRGAFSASRVAVTPQRRAAVAVRAESEAAAPAAAGVEKSMSYFKPVLDIEAIKGVLPHRCVNETQLDVTYAMKAGTYGAASLIVILANCTQVTALHYLRLCQRLPVACH